MPVSVGLLKKLSYASLLNRPRAIFELFDIPSGSLGCWDVAWVLFGALASGELIIAILRSVRTNLSQSALQ